MDKEEINSRAPFTIHAQGFAEIPHLAERALINVTVSSSGTNKAAVSDEVLTTARHVQSLCESYSPQDETPEAKASAPLAHWSKTGLSATSYVPHYDAGKDTEPPRKYNSSINFDIRFRDFKALGAFGAKITALPHVELQNISWILTQATEKSYHSQLRREAARDALAKATDYCEVFGCGKPRPVELNEGGISKSNNSTRVGLFGQSRVMQTARKSMAAPAAAGSSLFGGSLAANPQEDESDSSARGQMHELEFEPQEVKMSLTVTVEFHADHPDM